MYYEPEETNGKNILCQELNLIFSIRNILCRDLRPTVRKQWISKRKLIFFHVLFISHLYFFYSNPSLNIYNIHALKQNSSIRMYMRMRLFAISTTASARLLWSLFAIHIFRNRHILVFWVFFVFLLWFISNNFKNNLNPFLVFRTCFNFFKL